MTLPVVSLNKELSEFEKYVKLRLAELKKEIDSAEKPAEMFSTCPFCWQDTLIINEENDGLSCLFCASELDFNERADYSEANVGPCPDCDNGVLGLILYNNEDGECICVKCGFKTDYSYNRECSSCGNTFWDESEKGICESCYRSLCD